MTESIQDRIWKAALEHEIRGLGMDPSSAPGWAVQRAAELIKSRGQKSDSLHGPISKNGHEGSAVLWIRAPGWVSEKLASFQPVGLENRPSIDHVSIVVYPGDEQNPVDGEKLADALVPALAFHRRLECTITGTAWFYSGVLVYVVSIPGLETIRHKALQAASPDQMKFGMVPHLTIGYLPEDSGSFDAPPDPGVSWVASDLEVVMDDEIMARIPLV